MAGNILREEYVRLVLWSRPLRKRRYSFSAVRMKRPPCDAAAAVPDPADAEYTGILAPDDVVFSPAPQDSFIEVPRVKKKRFRRLAEKIDDTLFDYSEIRQEELEEEIQNLVNMDGYYDEVVPIDAGEEYTEKAEINGIVIALFAALFMVAGAFSLYIRFAL